MKKKPLILCATTTAAVLLLTGCGGAANSGSGNENAANGSVVVVDGGGDMHDALNKALYEPFEAETGIDVIAESFDYSQGTIQAQVQGAQQWDIVSTSVPLTEEAAAEVYKPIDYNVVDASDYAESDAQDYFLWYVYSANNIAWNTDAISSEPTSWEALWDTETYPGPRALWNSPQSTLELALLADGVQWEDMYPLDLDRAFTKLDELRKRTDIVWYDSGAQQQQNFSSGASVLGEGWNGRIRSLREQGEPVDYTLAGAISGGTAWSVMKTAPNSENAMKFLAYAAKADVNAQLAELFPGMSPANTASYKMLDEELALQLESNPVNSEVVGGKMDYDWWAKNYDEVFAAWQEWYTSE